MYSIKDLDRTENFFKIAKEMMKKSNMHNDLEITPDNVFQEAHLANRDTLLDIMRDVHLPGSNIFGVENILQLNKLAKEGKSCLILSEHVSNMDVTSMFCRFYDHENLDLKDIFENLVFIAGMKLNATPIVKLFSEMFTRVVIYPIRSLKKLTENSEQSELMQKVKKINLRATRKILGLKNKGKIFVMFPSGTRYRPWDPDSGKGMKETMSYLNSFDYFCCASINGNNMPPREHEDMTREPFLRDIIQFNFGKVQKTTDLIEKIQSVNNDVDKDQLRQIMVDDIMEQIRLLHEQTEKERKVLLNKTIAVE